MWRWLLSDAIGDANGAIRSWANPRRPGYPYAEAAGLFLSSLSRAPRGVAGVAAAADRTAAWLCASVEADGAVGRGGIEYLFDSAVVLAGLLRYRAAGGRVGGDAPIHRLRTFIVDCIARGTSVRPASAAADGRWSTQFGAHQVKCLHSLYLYRCAFGEDVPANLISALIDRSGRQPSPTYVHPFCYEQEGHAVVAHYGLSSVFEPLDGALDLLVALQQPDGSIRAFANGMDGFGEARSDASAQAVRLWQLSGHAQYAGPIGRALAFLADCQDASGGILYTPVRDDVCSWSTMFALQAADWSVDGPDIDRLL